MAGEFRIPSKGPRRGAIKDLNFHDRSPPEAEPLHHHIQSQHADFYTERQPPTALSDITEATSHVANDAVRDIARDIKITKPEPRAHQICRDANAEYQASQSVDPKDRAVSDSAPSTSSDDAATTPPDDSSIPLAASSGKVGTLLVRIDRSQSRTFLYGNLIIIGALSHQTWVSGEVLCFDVEIDNTSEKFVKKIELQFVRAISANIISNDFSGGIRQTVEKTTKTLATWVWKKGVDGWSGVAPQTQMTRTWNPIVPAGQATTSERGVEASYSLAISVPTLIGRAACAYIPLKIIHPNSLGKLRLEQRLQHAFRTSTVAEGGNVPLLKRSISQDTHLFRKSSRRPKSGDPIPANNEPLSKPKETGRASIDKREPLSTSSWDVKRDIESNLRSIFLNTNPIPRASDELLDELLPKLQSPTNRKKSRRSPRKHNEAWQKQHKMADQAFFATGVSSALPKGSRPFVLKPLSAIGAHCRRKSSDDIRQKPQDGLLNPPPEPVARASFDDYIRFRRDPRDGNEETTRTENFAYKGYARHSKVPPPPPPVPDHEHSGKDEVDCSSDENEDSRSTGLAKASGNNGRRDGKLDMPDIERFIRERRSFQTARRNSSNPFFKGSAGKERLCSVRYSSLKQKRLTEERQRQARYNSYRQRASDIMEESREDPTEADYASTYFRRRHSKANADRSSKYIHPAALKYAGQRTLF